MKVTLYTDGAARGNPDGPGGYGAVLQFIDKNGTLHEKELSAGYVRTTNNRMELMAAIVGLEALNRSCEVDLYSDSKYLVDAFNQKWIDGWVKHNWVRPKTGPVKNSDGHPGNERCDRLATSAADGGDLLVDTGLSN